MQASICRLRPPWLRYFALALALAIASASALPCAAEEASAAGAGASSLHFEAGGLAKLGAACSFKDGSLVGGPALMRPRLKLSYASLELAASARLRFGQEGVTELGLEELALEAKFPWSLELKAGRFAYTPGPAFLLSNVDYFSAFDFERLVEEGFAYCRRADELAQASYGTGPWRFAATFAPLSPGFVETSTSSPWLPLGGIEESFTSALGIATYELKDVVWDDTDSGRSFDPAYSLEAGLEGEDWNLALSYFDGADRDPVPVAKASFLSVSSYGDYDLYLRRSVSRVRRVGACASYSARPWEAYADASWFQGRLLATGSPYYSIGEWQSTLSATGIIYCLGAAFDLPLPRSSIGLEWRNSWYPMDVSSADAPFLERSAAARASAFLPGGEAGLELFALYSLEDGSYALFPSVELVPAAGRSIVLEFLLFSGGASSELGRYAKSNRVGLYFSIAM
jgi:hypothetical protein